MKRPITTALALTLSLATVDVAAAQTRTLVKFPSEDAFLINKTITLPERTERWTIEYRPGDAFVGNVTYEGTGETGFVYCDDNGLNAAGTAVEFDCQVRSRDETAWSPVGGLEIAASFLGVGGDVLVAGDRTYTDDAVMQADCDHLRVRQQDVAMRRWRSCVTEAFPLMLAETYSVCEVTALAKAAQLGADLTAMGCFLSSGDRFLDEAQSAMRTAAAADKGTRPLNKIVFVSSTKTAGDMSDVGGFGRADAHCTMLANDAGIAGTFRAWLSTPSNAARDRFERQNGEYELVDGMVVADSWDDLTDRQLTSPINLDENGTRVDGESVWTSTLTQGAADTDNHCSSFTSDSGAVFGLTGNTSSADALWTDGGIASCGQSFRIYCFEQ